MKKLISVLALLVLVTCVVFAETITLNSTVNAGSGVTESGTGSVISGGDQQGFWLKVSYDTDNDSSTIVSTLSLYSITLPLKPISSPL